MKSISIIDADFVDIRLFGGFLMGLVGILYLLFERSILSSATSGTQSLHKFDTLSRGIVGAQIGLILMAMIVTRSSVLSIQAKRGLPLGNQVIGWIVLSTKRAHNLYGHKLTIDGSCIPFCAIPTQPSAEQSLPPPTRHHISHLLAHLHHTDYLL